MTPINSTVLNVSWEQGIGSYEYFNVEYNDCKSPDKAFDDKANKTKKLSSIRAGLLPGTYCNVSVTAHAGNQTSGPQFSENVRRTYETGVKFCY